MTLEQQLLMAFEDLENFTYKDVASELEIKQSYAKVLLSRLKTKGKVQLLSKGTWQVIHSGIEYTVKERKRTVLQEQFELLARLNEESDSPEEIEERIKLMIRLAKLF
ncbi:TrmB family transcriptional regulator [Staphylococcus aureus]|uniref:TrmB family transcriptional regulator n=1 Tax=Staphylococcus aureus TaxID=1280 RepID=UPI0018EDDB66|nr:TrmB family transcriptional regulator [Staphylococcus aureus]MBJ6275262.1 TrmB family transcriptional regulator [Staphylococcus aureus]MBJ6280333.1 TrmB family transcriptional regulator [Staphylococcus aureus]MBJ6283058.1 TrmB family transcriptional regulator [Staphylococcus aureus]MBJ6285743.1 TrmB family transcriptional regulator [Staphylococcus aureus]MBJ6299004.1 TrmB family transcriptional regulator [Staphylococcus aureus]